MARRRAERADRDLDVDLRIARGHLATVNAAVARGDGCGEKVRQVPTARQDRHLKMAPVLGRIRTSRAPFRGLGSINKLPLAPGPA